MLVVVVLALFGTSLSAVLDPSLTEWRLITQDQENVMFPLRDYILEVKAFRPDVYDTNPPYSQLFKTDKPTTMMMVLHAGGWGPSSKVGRLVWNTIKYDRGYDIAVEECNVRYKAYNSFPAGGEKEQIWAWNFFDDHFELRCNGEMQYEQNFDEGEVSPYKPGLPAKCRALGDADVDRIIFKHMAGEYIRGRPKNGIGGGEEESTDAPDPIIDPVDPVEPDPVEPDPVEPDPVEPDPVEPDPVDPDPVDPEEPDVNPTCNCWTRECGFCSKLECTVKHDLVNSEVGITVTSALKWKKLNSIMLFDENGNALGSFQWSLRSIHLTGCVSCQTPPAMRQLKRGDKTAWNFSLKDGVLQLKVDGEVLYENKLKGKCAETYSEVKRFSFYDSTCESTFNLTDEMEAGEMMNSDCGGTCPEE